jgi:hypothetical protein
MKTPTLLLITAGSMASVFAQANSPDAPPQPPFLKRAPEKCQWQISTKASGNALGSKEVGAGRSASPPKLTTVVKNGKVVFETRTLENGSALQFWRMGGIALMSFSGRPWMMVQGGGNSFEDTDFIESDFAGFGWISEANFAGRQKVSGRPCLLFKDRVVTVNSEQVRLLKAAAEAAEAQAEFARMEASRAGKSAADVLPAPTPFREDDYKVEVTAYIDEETRLPIALVYMSPEGAMTRTYSFQPLSQAPQMPAEVQKMLQAYKQRQKMLGG